MSRFCQICGKNVEKWWEKGGEGVGKGVNKGGSFARDARKFGGEWWKMDFLHMDIRNCGGGICTCVNKFFMNFTDEMGARMGDFHIST